MVDNLYDKFSELVLTNDAIENTLWLQPLPPFTAVKNLYLSKEFTPGVAVSLQELFGARITKVLPSVSEYFRKRARAIGTFPGRQ